MISPELQSFLESGISVLVGTRDLDLVPECVRGVGARVEPGGAEVTVFVPVATGGLTVANAQASGRIAVCFSRPQDHRTIQLKGKVAAITDADLNDRAQIDRYREGFAEELGWLGVPPSIVLRFAHWPCHAIRFACDAVFVQTPGPGAGEPLGGAATRTRT